LTQKKRIKFQLTIPNILTVFRVLLIPVICYFLVAETFVALWAAFALYGLSALTDMLDGKIARKYNQESSFGAFLDPLADKILVLSVYTVFVFIDGLLIPLWLVAFLYVRDIFITLLRVVSDKKGIKFVTSFVAKAKTTAQMIAIACVMAYMVSARITALVLEIDFINYPVLWEVTGQSWIAFIPLALTFIIVAFTLYSGAGYFISFLKARRSDG